MRMGVMGLEKRNRPLQNQKVRRKNPRYAVPNPQTYAIRGIFFKGVDVATSWLCPQKIQASDQLNKKKGKLCVF